MSQRRHLQLAHGESWSSGQYARSYEERSRRPRDVRATTIAQRRISKRQLAAGRLLFPPGEDAERPVTRADCIGGERPCPYISCKWNLYLDVSSKGSIKLNFPDLEIWEMKESCALDVADRGPTTLETVGACINLTRERARQVEVKALTKFAADDDAVALAIGAIGR